MIIIVQCWNNNCTSTPCPQFDEILSDLDEQRELATNRLAELERLQKDHQKALKEIEQLKLDVSEISASLMIIG